MELKALRSWRESSPKRKSVFVLEGGFHIFTTAGFQRQVLPGTYNCIHIPSVRGAPRLGRLCRHYWVENKGPI